MYPSGQYQALRSRAPCQALGTRRQPYTFPKAPPSRAGSRPTQRSAPVLLLPLQAARVLLRRGFQDLAPTVPSEPVRDRRGLPAWSGAQAPGSCGPRLPFRPDRLRWPRPRPQDPGRVAWPRRALVSQCVTEKTTALGSWQGPRTANRPRDPLPLLTTPPAHPPQRPSKSEGPRADPGAPGSRGPGAPPRSRPPRVRCWCIRCTSIRPPGWHALRGRRPWLVLKTCVLTRSRFGRLGRWLRAHGDGRVTGPALCARVGSSHLPKRPTKQRLLSPPFQ